MKTVIAVKRIGRTLPGQTVRLSDRDARVMVAIGHAAYAPEARPVVAKPAAKVVTPKVTRNYQRRDMVATTAVPDAKSVPSYYIPKPFDGK